MPPLCLPLDCSLTPGEVLRAVRDEERPFALVGRWAGSRAIVGWEPSSVVRGSFPPDVAPVGAAQPDVVGGGWFGYLGFGMGAQVERLPPAPPRPAPLPDAVFGWYSSVLRLDDSGRWWFEALADDAVSRARFDAIVERLVAGPPAARPFALDGMTLHGGGADAHRAAGAECVERIAAGELFQANLCLRLDGRLRGSAADAFAAAAAVLRPAYGGFFGMPDGDAVLSFSPELFLRRSGRSVVTAPIKGTAPRVDDEVAAAAARDALVASAKDAAEHVMIVDLMRNDLGRVAAYGTVEAAAEPDVEAHPGLWHLVTRVRAQVRDEVGDEELLRATFPPGSVTGAPKVQALKVISALEGTAREVYTGAVGYISPVAGLELNVAIRTLELRGERAWLGCGGGIVADSDPEAELREALGKARPIVEALGGRVPAVPEATDAFLSAGDPNAATIPGAPAATPRLTRPDPARGVFETIAVRDGRVIELDRHLRRLAASVGELYGAALPDDLAVRATAAASVGDHRLRVTVLPDGTATVSSTPASPGRPADVALEPVVLAGGLGAHKWADRSPLASHPGGLICDLDGAVLESASANVWAIEGDTLVTPPADGRLLPGTTRARLLELGSVGALTFVQSPLDLDRLRSADGLVVTSSIRLAAPAALEDGAVTDRARTVAAGLRAALAPPVPSAPVGPVAQLVRAADS